MQMITMYSPFDRRNCFLLKVYFRFSLLRLILCKGKLRHAEQINQMVFVCEGLMLAILCLLKLALQSHLRIKLTVLIDVVLVLDFLLVGQTREILLVLCLQPGKGSVILCLRIFLLLGAACHNLGIVVLLEMLIEILLGIRDQAVDLCLVLLLHGFCRYELFLSSSISLRCSSLV